MANGANFANGFYGNPVGGTTWAGPPPLPQSYQGRPSGMPRPVMPWMPPPAFPGYGGIPGQDDQHQVQHHGGGGPSWGPMMQGPKFRGGLGSESYTQHNDALPPVPPGYSPPPGPPPTPQKGPPAIPGAPNRPLSFDQMPGGGGIGMPSNMPITGGTSFENMANKGGIGMPPTPAWTGGHFMPGQSAIVGDKPNGSPGPNAEVVTAMPGGGFTVTPNAKNASLPRLAGGTGGQTFGIEPGEWSTPPPIMPTVQKFNVPPSPAIEYEKSQQSALHPQGWMDHVAGYVDRALDSVGGALDEGIGGNLYDFATDNANDKANAQARLNNLHYTGRTPNQPSLPPVGTIGVPPSLARPNPLKDLENPGNFTKGLVNNFTKDATTYSPEMFPTFAAEEPPTAAPPQAWDDRTMMAYVAAYNAGQDPDAAAARMMATNHDASPINFAGSPPPRTAAQDNAILQRWQQPPPSLTPPAGLSPEAGQAWQQNRQHQLATMAGRSQILQTEMDRLGTDRKYDHEVAMKNLESQNTYANQQAVQDRKDLRGVAMSNAHQAWQQNHEIWRQQQEEAKNAPKNVPIPGGGIATMVGNKVIHKAEPIHPPGFVPDSPDNPTGFGVHFNGADNKPERGVMGKDGLFHKGGEKPDAPAKEEKFNAYQTDPTNGKVTYLHHPPGHKTPPGVTLLEPTGDAPTSEGVIIKRTK